MAAPNLFSASRGKAARSCRRLHHLRYGQGWRSVDVARQLRFGTLVHQALEAWWKAKQAGAGVDVWLEAALEALAVNGRDVDPVARVKARVLVVAYHFRWCAEDFEVLGVELQFEGPLVNPATGRPSKTWRLAGKLDVLVRTPAGEVLVVEHKTTTEDIEEGGTYWKRLRLDSQVSIYFEGGRLLGHQVAACLYDVLRVPRHELKEATPPEARKYTKEGRLYATQRLEAETLEAFEARVTEEVASRPADFLARGTVVRLEAERAEGLVDVWDLAQSLTEEARKGRHPRTPEACFTWGRPCEFWGVCTGEESLEDARLFTRGPIHPELTP